MKAHSVLGSAVMVALATVASAQTDYVYVDDLQSIEREMQNAASLSLPSTEGPATAANAKRFDPNVTPVAATRPVAPRGAGVAMQPTTDDVAKRPSFFSRLKPKWPFGGKPAAEPAVDPFAAAIAARREAQMQRPQTQRPQTATPIATTVPDGGVTQTAYGQRGGIVTTRRSTTPEKGLLESMGLFGPAEQRAPQPTTIRPPSAPTTQQHAAKSKLRPGKTASAMPKEPSIPLAMRKPAPRQAMGPTTQPMTRQNATRPLPIGTPIAAMPTLKSAPVAKSAPAAKPATRREPAGEAYVVADSEPAGEVVMISDSGAKPAAKERGAMPIVQNGPQTSESNNSAAPQTNPYATGSPKPLASLYSAATVPGAKLRQPTREPAPTDSAAPSPLVVASRAKRIPAAKPFPRTKPAPRPSVASADLGQPSDRARALLAESNALAQQAATIEDHSAIVQRCRYVLAIDQTKTAVDYANQLASWSLNKRGELLDEEGRLDEAEVDFRDALDSDPECWRAIHNLGVLEARRGDHRAARERFDRTIELNPEYAKAHSNRAALAVQEGDFDAAMDDYQRAIDCDPDLAVAHTGRGRVCHMLGHLDAALRHLDAAQVLSPEDAMIASGRGDLMVDLGRYGQAKQAYELAIALAPESPTAYRNLAWMQATCPVPAFRDGEAALENTAIAERLSSQVDDITLDTKAAALAAAGRFDEALTVQERAIELAPEVEVEVYRERLAMYSEGEAFTSEPVTPIRQAAYESGRLR